jgi:hypothetical protein
MRIQMTEPGTRYTATFTVDERCELEAMLDRETAAAIAFALPQGFGVVLTRHDAHTFTVEASPEVPPGVVSERDLFARTRGGVVD